MSYDIVYQTQFIRSHNGLTPAILSGPSNVWEQGRLNWHTGRYTDRRSRDWGLYGNLLCATGEELIAKVEGHTGGPYQEHWMSNGKWVDDEGIRRWVRRSIKDAATLEEILEANPDEYVEAYLTVYLGTRQPDGPWSARELNRPLKSTSDLDAWIADAQLRTQEILDADKEAKVYPAVCFSTEKLNRPKARGKTPLEVVLRVKGKYVTNVEDGTCVHYSTDIHNALRLPYEQAVDIKKRYLWTLQDAKLVDAKAADAPYDAVIKLVDGRYIASYSGRKATLTYSQAGAKKYRDAKAAEKALERLAKLLAYNGLVASVETV